MSTFHLDILTPYKKYLSKDISFLEVRNEDSVLGILPHHANIITTVSICDMKIRDEEGKETLFAIGGGLLSIKDNVATLMVNSIESQDEIDFPRAERAKQRAMARLEQKLENLDVERAQLALLRATVRINLKK
ncbi:MAG: ATP synthase F1 subunit epsilon [Erysipelotrichaceae bacterium]|nr:ATP synthase F1 subunit epsilon [Erysipelotrichaceae bacterium]